MKDRLSPLRYYFKIETVFKMEQRNTSLFLYSNQDIHSKEGIGGCGEVPPLPLYYVETELVVVMMRE